MTHFAVLVLVDEGADEQAEVTRLMRPYDENDEWFRDGSRWDWWVVGGRFTSLLDPAYDPYKDPQNLEPCEYCEGTGTTTAAVADRYPAYREHVGKTCIQCEGIGKRVKSQLAPFDGDRQRASEVDLDKARFVPSAVVTPDGEWHEQHQFGWFGAHSDGKEDDAWKSELSGLLKSNPDKVAVVVDAHV